MHSYYIDNNGQQEGPFSIDDLKSKNLKRTTLVWKEGLKDWVQAGEMEDLKELFESTPPPLPQTIATYSTTELTSPPKRKKPALAWVFGLLIIAAAVFFYFKYKNENTNNKSDSADNIRSKNHQERKKTPEEIKTELSQTESESPEKYLSVTGQIRKNLIGEVVTEGRIKNNATAAAFKDIVIEVSFLAPSGTKLGSQKFTRYEVLGPGYDVTYKFKTTAPKETISGSVRVVSATPID